MYVYIFQTHAKNKTKQKTTKPSSDDSWVRNGFRVETSLPLT